MSLGQQRLAVRIRLPCHSGWCPGIRWGQAICPLDHVRACSAGMGCSAGTLQIAAICSAGMFRGDTPNFSFQIASGLNRLFDWHTALEPKMLKEAVQNRSLGTGC
jgi:hypothetical protein